jgi:hypothetical protein
MHSSQTKKPKPPANMKEALMEIARIGALFLDGDAAEAVHAGPTSATWTDPDDINFAHEPYINVKRTLMLIERMQPFYYEVLFALRRADNHDLLEAVVCNLANPHGRGPFQPNKAQRDCIVAGKITAETTSPGHISAYAPVRNSDDEIVGLLQALT